MKILSDKILFLLLLVLLGTGAISCSEDVEEVGNAEVTFTATLQEDAHARAFGDGSNVDRLVVGVFDVDLIHQVYRETFHVEGSSVDVELSLPRNRAYRFVFWAYNNGCSAYNMDDLRNIKMMMKKTEDGEPSPVTFAEVENSDAFFAIYPKDDEETGDNHGFVVTSKNPDTSVVLTRPLAQINVGTSGEAVGASFSVKHTPDTFHPFTGTVSGEESFTWTFDEITHEAFPINETSYTYLAMGYVFAPLGEAEAMTKACELVLRDTDRKMEFPTVELHANRRSNIAGSFTE